MVNIIITEEQVIRLRNYLLTESTCESEADAPSKNWVGLNLPYITERDMGSPCYKDREYLQALLGSDPDPINRVRDLADVINNSKSAANKDMATIIQNLVFLDVLRNVVHNHSASPAGFLLEALFATITGGKQVIEKSADGSLPIEDFTAGDVAYSSKLLDSDSHIKGSKKNLMAFFEKNPDKTLRYFVGLKDKSGDMIEKITFFDFPLNKSKANFLKSRGKNKSQFSVKASCLLPGRSGGCAVAKKYKRPWVDDTHEIDLSIDKLNTTIDTLTKSFAKQLKPLYEEINKFTKEVNMFFTSPRMSAKRVEKIKKSYENLKELLAAAGHEITESNNKVANILTEEENMPEAQACDDSDAGSVTDAVKSWTRATLPPITEKMLGDPCAEDRKYIENILGTSKGPLERVESLNKVLDDIGGETGVSNIMNSLFFLDVLAGVVHSTGASPAGFFMEALFSAVSKGGEQVTDTKGGLPIEDFLTSVADKKTSGQTITYYSSKLLSPTTTIKGSANLFRDFFQRNNKIKYVVGVKEKEGGEISKVKFFTFTIDKDNYHWISNNGLTIKQAESMMDSAEGDRMVEIDISPQRLGDIYSTLGEKLQETIAPIYEQINNFTKNVNIFFAAKAGTDTAKNAADEISNSYKALSKMVMADDYFETARKLPTG